MATILVIGGLTKSLLTVSSVLAGEGHNIVRARDGAEGLLAASSQVFDLVIVDVKQSIKDGSNNILDYPTTKTHYPLC